MSFCLPLYKLIHFVLQVNMWLQNHLVLIDDKNLKHIYVPKKTKTQKKTILKQIISKFKFRYCKLIVFFKVISDFGVSRLFKELACQYSRCSRIASFCRRDLKKMEVLQQKSITQKNFWKFFGLNKPKNQFWKMEFQKNLTSIFQNWFFWFI